MKRTISYGKFLLGGGIFANVMVYATFLTGIYNFRTQEILAMKRIPFVVKFALSTAVSGFMCHRLWVTSLYDHDLYRLSVKYRHKYDLGHNLN